MHQPLWTRWERRLDLLMPGDWRSLFMAAIFPEVAALAAILAAPPARRPGHAARHALGYAEPPNRHDISDALSIWATGREAGRFLQPASAYSPAGHHHDGTPRITKGRLIASGRPPPASAETGAHHSSPAQDRQCPTPAWPTRYPRDFPTLKALARTPGQGLQTVFFSWMQVRPPRALPPWRGDKLEWQWNGKFRQASGGRLAPSASVQPVELADIPDNVSENAQKAGRLPCDH